ncbi:MAG: D-aminoacyl-tRNA deacylase [Alloalcanivorax sp.]
MKVLVQRCREAQVVVAEETVGAIGYGSLLLVGIEKGDDDAAIKRMAERVLSYRLFSDEEGKMNRDIRDVQGELLVVSQFTLAADTRKGRRPSFSSAAVPEEGRRLYLQFVDALKEKGLPVATGEFGADMQVHLINDGPVTFMLSV